jgi:hypothetical protein
MATFTNTWNATFESLPPDTGENASLGASRIRAHKLGVRERLEIDHSWAGDAHDGKHKKATLKPQGSDPTLETGDGAIYSKTVATIAEMFYKDSDGNVIQLTSGGFINAQDAETLDGLDSTAFVRSDIADAVAGVLTFNAIPAFNGGTTGSTAPFTVDSTFKVTNLNADLLDGLNESDFVRSNASDTVSGVLTFSAIPAFNGGTSGSTSPFTVDSTQVVPSLNADLLDGSHASAFLGVGAKAADSELLDGINSLQFLRSDVDDTFNGTLDITGKLAVGSSTNNNQLHVFSGGNFGTDGETNSGITIESFTPALKLLDRSTGAGSALIGMDQSTLKIFIDADVADGTIGQSSTTTDVQIFNGTEAASDFINELRNNGNRVLTVADEGAGNGLDADTLDGLQATSFMRSDVADTFTAIPAFNGGTSGSSAPFTVDSTFLVTNLNADLLDGINGASYARSDVADTFTAIPAFNGGVSGTSAPFTVDSTFLVTNLNADLLDGIQGASYARSDVADTFTAIPAFNGGLSGSSAPFTVDSTFLVTNLNADLLDGQSGAFYQNSSNQNAGTLPSARLPAASTTVVGGVELTTNAEAQTGTDTTRAVTAAALHAAVGNAIAGLALDAVGTYSFSSTAGTVNPGSTIGGSALDWAESAMDSGSSSDLATPVHSGTWRCMGYILSGAVPNHSATLWLRIS